MEGEGLSGEGERILRESWRHRLGVAITVQKMREAFAAQADEGDAPDERLLCDGVGVRLWRGSTEAMVYLHGGGWYCGGGRAYDSVCRRLGDRTGLTVVSIDYPLAPEHGIDSIVDSCANAFEQLLSTAVRSRVTVVADSVGAYLALGVCQRPQVAAGVHRLILVVPALDPSCESQAYQSNDDREDLLAAWHAVAATADFSDPATLRSVPPSAVFVAGCDPLKAEGIRFAESLRRRGLLLGFEGLPGVPHEFWFHANNTAFDTAARRIGAVVRA